MDERFSCLILAVAAVWGICSCTSPTNPPAKLAAPTANPETVFRLGEGEESDHVKRLYTELIKNKQTTIFRTIGPLHVEMGEGECTTRYDRRTGIWAIEFSGLSNSSHEEAPDGIYGHYIYKFVTDDILIRSIRRIPKDEDSYFFMRDFGHNLRAKGAKEVFRFPLYPM